MAVTEISKEYAAALFSLGRESGKAPAFGQAMREVADSFAQNPAYEALLASPDIAAEERQSLVRRAFANAPEEVLNLLCLMVSKGRAREIPACCEQYRRLTEAAEKMSTAYVTSATALTGEQKQRLKRRLEQTSGRSVTLQCRVDPALIGGLKVEMDGRSIDGSLRGRLREVKEVIGG